MTAISSSVASLRSTIALDGARRRRGPPGRGRPGRSRRPRRGRSRPRRGGARRAAPREGRLEEGRVAGQDEDLVDVVRERRRGRRHGVAGAARIGLERVVDVVAEGVADRGGGGARDDERATARCVAAGVDDVRDHRPAGELVEELRHARLHPRAEAGRHDDGSHARGRAGTWRVHEGRRERARVGGAAIPTRSGPGACRGVSVIEGWRDGMGGLRGCQTSGSVARRPMDVLRDRLDHPTKQSPRRPSRYQP